MSIFESRFRPRPRLHRNAGTALVAGVVAFATPVAANAAAPAGTGYVGSAGSFTVTPFDVFTNTLAPPISASAPRALAITPDGATPTSPTSCPTRSSRSTRKPTCSAPH